MSNRRKSSAKIALVQFPFIESMEFDALILMTRRFLDEALHHKPDLIVFPELYAMSLTARSDSDQQAGSTLTKLAKSSAFLPLLNHFNMKAISTKTFIISGSLPFFSRGKVTNRCHYFSPDGPVQSYDKQLLTPEEKNYRWHSGKSNQYFSLNSSVVMPLICYDVESPKISARLAKKSVDLLIVPSLTSEKGRHRVHACARARAVEHHCFVAVTGVCDESSSPEYVSQAAIYAPSSEMFSPEYALGRFNQKDILLAELDFAMLGRSKKTTGYYPARDHR
jgi:predicted amidohydrolase